MTQFGPPSGRPLRFLIVLTAVFSILSAGSLSQAGTTQSAAVLRLRYWQAPTLLNPHLSTGNKDQEASRLTYEPLASFHFVASDGTDTSETVTVNISVSGSGSGYAVVFDIGDDCKKGLEEAIDALRGAAGVQ